MSIEEQFNLIAQEYDANRKRFIPCFHDFYESTTAFLLSNIPSPKRVLDLGAGTGLLTYFWHRQCPSSEYVLADIAEEMLSVARKRFAGSDKITYQILDYSKELPQGNFDVIASSLSIHHLEQKEKQSVFKAVYEKLPKEGLFVNYDQFCGGQDQMNAWFDSHWENYLANSGLSEHDLTLWRERRKLDRECSVEEEAEMLRAAGFGVVKCVYACQKFAVIAALK